VNGESSVTPINYPRVLLGALVAGVVANICDFITNGILLVDDMNRMSARLNLNPDVVSGPSVMITWIVVDFVYAFLIVWTYAAIRPRLGPGPKTAAVAGLVIVAAVTVVLVGFQQMGVFTMDSFIKSAVLSTITAVLAGLAGGAVYRE
jgi:hypothetical protein